MRMREPAESGNDEVPIPVFYVLEIYLDTFRHEKPVVEIQFLWVTIFTKSVFQIRSAGRHAFSCEHRPWPKGPLAAIFQ